MNWKDKFKKFRLYRKFETFIAEEQFNKKQDKYVNNFMRDIVDIFSKARLAKISNNQVELCIVCPISRPNLIWFVTIKSGDAKISPDTPIIGKKFNKATRASIAEIIN